MKAKSIIAVLIINFGLVSCAPTVTAVPTETAAPTITLFPTKTAAPTITLFPTKTATPTITPFPTQTLIPSPTPIPQPTSAPEPPQVANGVIFYQWGMENNTSPYLVWGAQLRNTMNGDCQGFICGGKDLREYDSEVWQFLGRGEYGKIVFTFDKPLDTFVITYKGTMGFDALSGTTVDGKTVTYGYLVDGTVSTSYMDTSNFSMKTIGDAEDNHRAVTKPCGMIDPNPDGDGSFNVTLGRGGIVWNFLDRPWGSTVYSTRKGYSLTSLAIVSQPRSRIDSSQICP